RAGGHARSVSGADRGAAGRPSAARPGAGSALRPGPRSGRAVFDATAKASGKWRPRDGCVEGDASGGKGPLASGTSLEAVTPAGARPGRLLIGPRGVARQPRSVAWSAGA